MRTAVVEYSYFYDGNPRVGQNKAVSGGERAVNGLKRVQEVQKGFKGSG